MIPIPSQAEIDTAKEIFMKEYEDINPLIKEHIEIAFKAGVQWLLGYQATEQYQANKTY